LTSKESPKLIKEVDAGLTGIAGCYKPARSAQAANGTGTSSCIGVGHSTLCWQVLNLSTNSDDTL
jgi:hypothetical protein